VERPLRPRRVHRRPAALDRGARIAAALRAALTPCQECLPGAEKDREIVLRKKEDFIARPEGLTSNVPLPPPVRLSLGYASARR